MDFCLSQIWKDLLGYSPVVRAALDSLEDLQAIPIESAICASEYCPPSEASCIDSVFSGLTKLRDDLRCQRRHQNAWMCSQLTILTDFLLVDGGGQFVEFVRSKG